MILIIPSKTIAIMREILTQRLGDSPKNLVLKKMTDEDVVHVFMATAVAIMQEDTHCHTAPNPFQKGGLN